MGRKWFWNAVRETLASVRSPNKSSMSSNLLIKLMQKIWFEINENQRPCESLSKRGEKCLAKSAFQGSLKSSLFGGDSCFSVRVKWSSSQIKHLEEELTAFQIFEKMKNENNFSSPFSLMSISGPICNSNLIDLRIFLSAIYFHLAWSALFYLQESFLKKRLLGRFHAWSRKT